MVNLSILCFVCFLLPLCLHASLGIVNSLTVSSLLEKLIIIYIYFIIISETYALKTCSILLEPVPKNSLIYHPNLKNLSPYGTGRN